MHKITADGTSKTDIVGISSTDAEGRLAEYEGTSDDFPSAKCVRLRNISQQVILRSLQLNLHIFE